MLHGRDRGVRPRCADLQHDLVEIEAFAHAARALVDSLPRIPWPEDGEGIDARLSYGRMPVLVEAVADAAHRYATMSARRHSSHQHPAT